MLKNLFLNGNFMKNIIIGLCLGLIITVWGFYYLNKDKNIVILPVDTVSPTPIVANNISDFDQIRKALADKYQKPLADVDLSISDNDGTHARGGVKFANEIAGAWILAAKVNDKWIIVQDGNGTISCETVAPYDFPVTMVSECVNSQGKLIKL